VNSHRTDSSWPALPLSEWEDTRATLHMLTQIVGKVRMALSPPTNHWWGTTLYVNSRGLTTSAVPYGGGVFEIQFDFVDHRLRFQKSDGAVKALALTARPVAEYYREIMATLRSLGIDVKIWTMPVEIPDPIPFDRDRQHASYAPEHANRFWRVLVLVHTIFEEFRARFIGKCSPVHFFWGSFDLAVTRFSGRRAPERPGADAMTREAYSHAVSSGGFWPGSGDIREPAFYSYAAPEPPGFAQRRIRPTQALYHPQLHEFFLAYEQARAAESPRSAVLDFLQSSYEAGADLGNWDRKALEK
jgi:hypothetical protein